MEKAIGTATSSAFRVRYDDGSWLGSKGLKVGAATIGAAAIQCLLDPEPDKHPVWHAAVKVIQGKIVDSILD
jgi:hypothetical protein